MERPFASVTVTEKAARALRGGHPWVFAGEVLTKESPCPDGEIVDVYTEKGRWQRQPGKKASKAGYSPCRLPAMALF